MKDTGLEFSFQWNRTNLGLVLYRQILSKLYSSVAFDDSHATYDNNCSLECALKKTAFR